MLSLKQIVPTYDISHNQSVNIQENNIVIVDNIELNVKDAALKNLRFVLPVGFSLTKISGSYFNEDNVNTLLSKDAKSKEVSVVFNKPVLGKTLLTMEIERGQNSFGENSKIGSIETKGANSERGTLQFSVEEGLQFTVVPDKNLREINVGSALQHSFKAQKSFRFKSNDWKYVLKTTKKNSSIHAESFHLIKLEKGRVIGSVAVSYFINDAPIQKLSFRCPKIFKHIEFIGGDVRRWQQDEEGIWHVELNRKVAGDYNLAMSYHYKPNVLEELEINNIECVNTDTQSGFIVLSSDKSIAIKDVQEKSELISINKDEIPEHYKLLIGSSVVAAYKHIGIPSFKKLGIEFYKSSELLPALIEMTEIKTQILPSLKEEVEEKTKITYKIINTDQQYFTVKFPKDAKIWSIRIKKDDQQAFKKCASTLEGDTLKIPLPRNVNPNEPATLEIEYGKSYSKLDYFGSVSIKTPKHELHSTMNKWSVGVPKEWAMSMMGSNALTSISPKSAIAFFKTLWNYIYKGFDLSTQYYQLGWLVFILCVCLAIILNICYQYMSWKNLTINSSMVIIFFIGLLITFKGNMSDSLNMTTDLNQIELSETLQLMQSQELSAKITIVPDWMGYFFNFECVLLLGLSALSFLLSFIKKIRIEAILIGAVSLLFSILTIKVTWVYVGFIMLCITPFSLFTFSFIQSIKLLMSRIPAKKRLLTGTAMLLLSFCLLPEMEARSMVHSVAKEKKYTILDSKFEVNVHKDTLDCKWLLHLKNDEEVKIEMPLQEIIFPNKQENKKYKIKTIKGKKILHIKDRGEHKVEIPFIIIQEQKDILESGRLFLKAPVSLKSGLLLKIPKDNLNILAKNTIFLTKKEFGKRTEVKIVLKPNQNIDVCWEPRSRERGHETTKFFNKVTTLSKVGRGLVENIHHCQLKITQGVLEKIEIDIPVKNAVTSVSGVHISSWQYKQDENKLVLILSKKVHGNYSVVIVTESTASSLPYAYAFMPIHIEGTEQESFNVGFISENTVTLEINSKVKQINTESYVKESHALLRLINKPIKSNMIENAFKINKKGSKIDMSIREKVKEIRSKENVSFSISDERLIYNGVIEVGISKAGTFSFDFICPKNYEIDDLSNPLMSHWEELDNEKLRVCRVYMNEWLLGKTSFRITLSQNISKVPDQLSVPKIVVLGSIKHTGSLFVAADQGIRINPSQRSGISEVKHVQKGNNKSFRILQSNWKLVLKPEIVQARINADVLMKHTIHEGMVKHEIKSRIETFNAGIKFIEFSLPEKALAVVIKGPNMAQIKEIENKKGSWKVKLEKKWFGKPYPLTVLYETRFNHLEGKIKLGAFKIHNVNLWKATIAVRSKGTMELTPNLGEQFVTQANARTISNKFGAGDLSDSVFCYSSSDQNINLEFTAKKHSATNLMGATVVNTDIKTVISKQGDQMTSVRLQLQVGNKRHLQLLLPEGANLWNMLVDGQMAIPTLMKKTSKTIYMIPLPHSHADSLATKIDFIYTQSEKTGRVVNKLKLSGPKFDIPLNNINWMCYVPEGLAVSNTEGTLTPQFTKLSKPVIHKFNANRYNNAVKKTKNEALKNALQMQNLSQELAQSGKQLEARKALESAYNYSTYDTMLNEDARVQLHQLAEQQAFVALNGTRGKLRARSGQGSSSQKRLIGQEWGANFKIDDAERLSNALSKDDNQNLNKIAKCFVELQTTSSLSSPQLDIHLPIEGRELLFKRPILVKPFSDLYLELEVASVQKSTAVNWIVFLALSVIMIVIVKRKMNDPSLSI